MEELFAISAYAAWLVFVVTAAVMAAVILIPLLLWPLDVAAMLAAAAIEQLGKYLKGSTKRD